ncbi:MAG: allophanate hydrolase subunit 1 [bacterium]
MRVLPCGERAVLLEVDDLPAVLSLAAALRADPVPGTVDLVPAARTVLVRTEPAVDVDAVRAHVARLTLGPADAGPPGPLVTVDVDYDGADLAAVAAACHLSPEEVVAAHAGREWTVAFLGFAPGFAYLTGGDPRLRVPRREVPRTRVPAGSVALADGYGAIYPRASPGGWQLIGRTDASVWDIDRDPPALLVPGTRVRFRELGR